MIACVFSMHLVAQIHNFSYNNEHFSRNTGFLTLCMLGNFACFLFRLLIYFKINFFKTFKNATSVSNSLDQDQDRRCVGPDLGPNCLQRLSLACEELNIQILKKTVF